MRARDRIQVRDRGLVRAKDRSQARAGADGVRARVDDLRSVGATRAIGG